MDTSLCIAWVWMTKSGEKNKMHKIQYAVIIVLQMWFKFLIV